MSQLASRESPLGTLAQSLGRLPLLLRSMEPTWFLDAIDGIDPAFVARHQVRGFIWDVDGTLTAYHAKELLPAAREPFERLRQLPGLRHAILSNAPEWRWRELGTMFPEIPVVRGYVLEGGILGRRLLGSEDSWTPEEAAAREAGGAVPLRKPSRALVELAVMALGCAPEDVVMVGDQHLTDIAGANLAGIRSIKVRNPARSSFPPSIRLSQRLEAGLYQVLGRRRR